MKISAKKRKPSPTLEKASAINPNSPNPDFIFKIANLRYLLNDFTGSIADYNRLLAMDKLYPRIYSKRAGSEAMIGQARGGPSRRRQGTARGSQGRGSL